MRSSGEVEKYIRRSVTKSPFKSRSEISIASMLSCDPGLMGGAATFNGVVDPGAELTVKPKIDSSANKVLPPGPVMAGGNCPLKPGPATAVPTKLFGCVKLNTEW